MPYNPPTAKTIKSSGRPTNPLTEVTHSFHCSPQTGTKRTQHFTAGLSWDSANFLLWEHFGSAISTHSSIYLDALEIDCGFFGFSWCRCWCWRGCRCWCCGCCRFLYVLLWCHLVSLKLESKGAPPKKNLKKNNPKTNLKSDSRERSSGQNELQPVPWRWTQCAKLYKGIYIFHLVPRTVLTHAAGLDSLLIKGDVIPAWAINGI